MPHLDITSSLERVCQSSGVLRSANFVGFRWRPVSMSSSLVNAAVEGPKGRPSHLN